MDATQGLRDAENALRDFIFLMMSPQKADWIEHCGVSADRIERWKERKSIEEKRQESGVVEERLIYYADFYDIKTILKKNWSAVFASALGDWKTFEVYLTELERLRDVDAHRRELLPHQKHLILGIAGEIRGRIVRHRSKMETPDDCFPRIESVRDNLGNIWTPGELHSSMKQVNSNAVLHPGDMLEFVVTASDPDDLPLEFVVANHDIKPQWQSGSNLQYTIATADISKLFALEVRIRSPREYHAKSLCDDYITFTYSVLPSPRSRSA